MGLVRVIQTAFSTGEISPRVYGQSDKDFYAHACKQVRNAIVFKQGGWTRRSGLRFVRAGKDQTHAIILIPVVASGARYLAEFGHNYVRIINRDTGAVVQDIASGYDAADLAAIKYVATTDRVYLVHPDYPPRILILSVATWFLSAVTFERGPFFVENASVTWTLTPSATTGTGITVTASVSTFSAGHVGSLWRITDGTTTGYFTITAFGSAISVTADVVETLPAGAQYRWSEGSWSTAKGFPAAVTTYQGRMVYGNSATQPDYVWASQTGNYDNFDAGTALDNEAYTFKISGVRKIRWLSGQKALVVGGVNAVISLDGGSDSVIAPANPPLSRRSAFGCSDIQPVPVHNGIAFVQHSGKVLREHVFDYQSDAYAADDLTALADHALGDGALFLDYQQGPYSIVWAVVSDGTLAGITYEKRNNVMAWHFHDTDGAIEHVVSVVDDEGTNETLWAVVRRTVGGATVRYIERFDDLGAFSKPMRVDCGVAYAAGATLNGLSHLEGRTVDVNVEDVVYPPQIVSSGAVTRPAAGRAEVGLHFDTDVIPVHPNVNSAFGPGRSTRRRYEEVALLVHESAGFSVNGRQYVTRRGADVPDEAPPLRSGWQVIENVDWGIEPDITIEQHDPLPLTVTALEAFVISEDK